MITIVDYGVGNINAFLNVYKAENIPAMRATNAEELASAEKIILPGVGAFDHAMERLNASGMRPALEKKVLEDLVPVIGICVGMQMLSKSSTEGVLPGLGWIDGEVMKFDPSKIPFRTKYPHMGWNNVCAVRHSQLLNNLEADAQFYFLHSYYFECKDKNDIVATANYGQEFACVVNHKNIFGIQCHPEKSHGSGVKLLTNFAKL